jgi:hypothetical protein
VISLRSLEARVLQCLTNVGKVIVRCGIVVILVQLHPYSIHAMESVKHIKAVYIDQLWNNVYG